MALHNPSHPGRILRQRLIEDECGQKLGSIAAVADQLGCHRNTLRRVVSGEASLKPEMALALELVGAGKAEFWLGMQASYDLFQLRQARIVAEEWDVELCRRINEVEAGDAELLDAEEVLSEGVNNSV